MISVIVPIYNVEKYLEKCVLSICNQTYKELEIILVDDGSTDRSGEICDRFAETDSRVIVVHKENGGLSDARNVGLKHACGELIGFVDGDDYIDSEMYESLYKAIINENARIAFCQYRSFNDNEYEYVKYDKKNYIYSGADVCRRIVTHNPQKRMTYAVWKFLYKREVLKEIFPFGRLHEDVCFTVKTLWNEERVCYVDKPLYYYRLRSDSITGKDLTEKRIKDIILYTEKLKEFFENNAIALDRDYLCAALIYDLVYFWHILHKSNMDSFEEMIIKEIKSFRLSFVVIMSIFIILIKNKALGFAYRL